MSNVIDEQFAEFLKKKVKISRDDEIHEGIIIGRSEAIVALSTTQVVRPWILRTKDGDIPFAPDDRWDIQLAKEN